MDIIEKTISEGIEPTETKIIKGEGVKNMAKEEKTLGVIRLTLGEYEYVELEAWADLDDLKEAIDKAQELIAHRDGADVPTKPATKKKSKKAKVEKEEVEEEDEEEDFDEDEEEEEPKKSKKKSKKSKDKDKYKDAKWLAIKKFKEDYEIKVLEHLGEKEGDYGTQQIFAVEYDDVNYKYTPPKSLESILSHYEGEDEFITVSKVKKSGRIIYTVVDESGEEQE